jgi:anti-sigma regulatory factor (Ser/Thr protein kinase)
MRLRFTSPGAAEARLLSRCDVVHAADLYGPRRVVREVGARLGFGRTDCQELAIVVSELTSNILKYGVRGSIDLAAVEDTAIGAGIAIVARDVGPPFRNVELALKDGYDDCGPIDPGSLLRRGGLGAGLGAVLRLTDSFEVAYEAGAKAIRVVRYLQRPRRR